MQMMKLNNLGKSNNTMSDKLEKTIKQIKKYEYWTRKRYIEEKSK